jgi:O-antigen/teichoic acid export membrane protein
MREPTHKIARLLRNFLALGIGNYGAMAVALGINAVLTRRLGVEQFGRLALLLMVSQLLSLVTSNWTQVGLVRFGAREFASTGSIAETVWTRVWVAGPWALAGLTALVALRGPLAAYLGVPSWAVWILLAHFSATFVLSTAGAVFQAQNNMRAYGAVLFFDKAALGASVLLVPLSWLHEPQNVLALYAASSGLVAVGAVLSLGVRSFRPIGFNAAAYRNMLRFSLPLILSSWAGLFGTNWFDLVLIKRYRPLSEVGWYSLGTLLAGVVQQVTIIFSTLLLPQFSILVADEDPKIRTLVGRILPYWFLAMSVLCSLILLSADAVVPLVFGRAFEPSVPVLGILMVATFALALFNAFSPLLSAFGATWALTAICLASGAVNVAMDLALIPRFGINGAAWATVLAYATSALLGLAFAEARLNVRALHLALLALPVGLVCAAFLSMDGVGFLLTAIPAGAISVYWLVRRFELFRGEDAVFLRGLRFFGRAA